MNAAIMYYQYVRMREEAGCKDVLSYDEWIQSDYLTDLH